MDNSGRIEEYLKKPQEGSDRSLYSHVIELVTQIVEEKGSNLSLEYVSRNINETRFALETKNKQLDNKSKFTAEDIEYMRQTLSLYSAKQTRIGELTKMSERVQYHEKIPDYEKIFHSMNSIGLGIKAEEAFFLNQAIHLFAATHPDVFNIKFWGKINAAVGCYYIVECDMKQHPSSPFDVIYPTTKVAETSKSEPKPGFIGWPPMGVSTKDAEKIEKAWERRRKRHIKRNKNRRKNKRDLIKYTLEDDNRYTGPVPIYLGKTHPFLDSFPHPRPPNHKIYVVLGYSGNPCNCEICEAIKSDPERQKRENIGSVDKGIKDLLRFIVHTKQWISQNTGRMEGSKGEFVAPHCVVLPIIPPLLVFLSRKNTASLTGDLERKHKLMCVPIKDEANISGKDTTLVTNEAYLLKARIVRINQSTRIAPDGYYRLKEEEEEEDDDDITNGGDAAEKKEKPPKWMKFPKFELNPEYEPPAQDEDGSSASAMTYYGDLGNWVHSELPILRAGLIERPEEEEEENEEPEKSGEEEEEKIEEEGEPSFVEEEFEEEEPPPPPPKKMVKKLVKVMRTVTNSKGEEVEEEEEIEEEVTDHEEEEEEEKQEEEEEVDDDEPNEEEQKIQDLFTKYKKNSYFTMPMARWETNGIHQPGYTADDEDELATEFIEKMREEKNMPFNNYEVTEDDEDGEPGPGYNSHNEYGAGNEVPEPLTSITNDTPILFNTTTAPVGEDGLPAWRVERARQCNTTSMDDFSITTNNFAPIAVRSMRWPGADTVVIGTEFYFVYVGDGRKRDIKMNSVGYLVPPRLFDIPADILEFDDFPPAYEREVQQRIMDKEQRERERMLAKQREEEEERKRRALEEEEEEEENEDNQEDDDDGDVEDE